MEITQRAVSRYAAVQERRTAILSVLVFLWIGTCLAWSEPTRHWVLILKTGAQVDCAAPYVVIDGMYTCRDSTGKNRSVPSEEVDIAKTATVNKANEITGATSVRSGASVADRAKTRQTAGGEKRPNPKAALYLLPLGPEAAEDTIALASYLHDALGLVAEPLPAVEPDKRSWNQERHQWNAGGLLSQVETNRKLGVRPNAVVIGVTDLDMYPPGVNWNFVFGWRDSSSFAVISSARFYLPTEENPNPTEEVRQSRLRKALLRQVGILYYGMPLKNDPHSVLHTNILGIDELDAIELRW